MYLESEKYILAPLIGILSSAGACTRLNLKWLGDFLHHKVSGSLQKLKLSVWKAVTSITTFDL